MFNDDRPKAVFFCYYRLPSCLEYYHYFVEIEGPDGYLYGCQDPSRPMHGKSWQYERGGLEYHSVRKYEPVREFQGETTRTWGEIKEFIKVLRHSKGINAYLSPCLEFAKEVLLFLDIY